MGDASPCADLAAGGLSGGTSDAFNSRRPVSPHAACAASGPGPTPIALIASGSSWSGRAHARFDARRFPRPGRDDHRRHVRRPPLRSLRAPVRRVDDDESVVLRQRLEYLLSAVRIDLAAPGGNDVERSRDIAMRRLLRSAAAADEIAQARARRPRLRARGRTCRAATTGSGRDRRAPSPRAASDAAPRRARPAARPPRPRPPRASAGFRPRWCRRAFDKALDRRSPRHPRARLAGATGASPARDRCRTAVPVRAAGAGGARRRPARRRRRSTGSWRRRGRG